MAPTIDELLAAVERAPDDERVFALATDALLEADEQQGKLMAGSLSVLEKGMLEAPLGELVKRFTGLGEIDYGNSRLTWRRGFVDAVSVLGYAGNRPIEKWWHQTIDLLTQTPSEPERLRAARLLQCVRRIEVGPFHGGAGTYERLWSLFAELPLPASVRHFNADMFPDEHHDEHQITWVTLGDLREVWPAFSRLESVRLRGSYVNLTGISLPSAKSFEVVSSSLTPENVAQLRGAKWPRLERLSLALGDGQYNDTPTTIDDIQRLVDTLPPTVKHLGLLNVPYSEELLHVFAASPKLKQLSEVDLSMGVLFDAAPILMQHADAFAHLKVLEVGDTGLKPSAELTAKVPALSWAKERREPKSERYVSVSE